MYAFFMNCITLGQLFCAGSRHGVIMTARPAALNLHFYSTFVAFYGIFAKTWCHFCMTRSFNLI